MIFNNSKPMDLLKVKDNNLWEAVSKINCEGKWFISAADLLVAEKFWFYRIQHSAFESVFKSLGTKTEDSLVKQLDLVQNESGLLESRGRQEILDKPSPLLLPKNHQITKLIIDDIHKENLHMRVGHTLAQVRQRFWIPHGRVVVKNVLNSCITCKKFHGGPFRLPDMPTLPRSRVCQSEPFQFVGLDYCGPMMIRKSRKEEPEKRWICIFTCLAIRAVHLEVVKDLSTESFLHTVQRFISRRGTPEKIISDNFSSFKMGQQVLDAMWQDTIDDAEVYSYFSKKGMNWNFITELSPWEGGFYERLIGSVKSCLRKALGRKIPILEDFITLVTKVEGILNSRPLTHSGEDISDLDRLITPANFLVGRKKLGLPAFGTGTNLEDPDFSLGESPAETVYRMFQNREKTLDSFWEIWHQDYLDLLRSRSQRDHRHPRILAKTSPWVGEVVLVHDANVPRSCWRLGQIVSLRRAGKDGMDVKSAEVRVPNGRIIRRPINLLFPLEIPCSTSDQQTPANPEEEILTVPKSEKVQMDRPKRIAAITCRKKIEDLSKDQALSGFISVPRECPGSSRRRNKNDEFAI
ncbi:MAG: transposase family protein [Gammaproteobacteria bacterium]|nr:transposase family protein [Gammaproteobacteria bacterium]